MEETNMKKIIQTFLEVPIGGKICMILAAPFFIVAYALMLPFFAIFIGLTLLTE